MPTLVQHPPAGSTTAVSRTKRRPTPWWQILGAFLAALLLLVGSIVFLAWALPHWPRKPFKNGAAPITLTIQPPEPSPSPGLHPTEDVSPQHAEYMRTTDAQKADTPPPDPKFISDKHTAAASEKPADDQTKPLPTQDGRDFAAFDFETNPYIAGKEAHDNNSIANPAASAPAPTPPPEAKENPTPDPQPTPTPGEFVTLKPHAPSNTPPPPSATPRPKSSSTPPIQDLLAQQAARVQQENRSVNSRSIEQPPGYQPQTVQTKMSGSTKDLGKSSVAALGTPLGKYEKAVSDVVASRWYQLVGDRMSDLVHTETVQIHFVVTRNGNIVGIRTDGSKRDTVLAMVSIQAINESELPPIPSDVASKLPEGQLEVDFTFGLFDQ